MKCTSCKTKLVFGDNIYEDMQEHYYCPNENCPLSDFYHFRDKSLDDEKVSNE